jgi:hypothetical protein
MAYDPTRAIAGTITVDGNTIIFTPAVPFEQNSIYEVTVSGDITSDGTSIGQDLTFTFQTTLNPFYSDVDTVLDDIGSWVQSLPRDLVARFIYRSSIFVQNEARAEYLELVDPVLLTYRPTWDARQFVRYDAGWNLLQYVYLGKVVEGGESIVLGDLQVKTKNSYTPDFQSAVKDLRSMRLKYLDAIMGHHGRRWAEPVVTQKGKSNTNPIPARGFVEL